VSGTAAALAVEHISKSFGPLVANDDISLSVDRGEMLALLGENGAGKSTLVKIIAGIYRPDTGALSVDGASVRIESARDAIRHGIGVVHQHFMLVSSLTVLENMQLGIVARAPIAPDRSRYAASAVRSFLIAHEFDVPVERIVGDLPVGLQQRLEVLKTLYWGGQILVLDEPTATLTPDQADDLFARLRSLAKRGHAIVVVTHKLSEALVHCDRVIVLRHGRIALTGNAQDLTAERLAEAIVGAGALAALGRTEGPAGSVALKVSGLCVKDDYGHQAIRDVDIALRRGEVLGLAGVDGNGQTELAEALYGARRPTAGAIQLQDVDVTTSPIHVRQSLGMRDIPPDRTSSGLISRFSVWENLMLEDHALTRRWERLDLAKAKRGAAAAITEFDIRTPNADTTCGRLSGGNQQKVVLARVLNAKPTVLIAEQPTRGLDVRATAYVHRSLLEARARGAAILLISSDLDEVAALADRIAVMFRGSIVDTMVNRNVDRNRLGRLMTGAEA